MLKTTYCNIPDPVPKEVDGVMHYDEGEDEKEQYLPSLLENVEKQDTGIPFPATAQTAKNVGFVVVCTECNKPRLLHANTS
jgi:ABC-type sulfate transport system substrate-binding protein